MEKLKNGLHFLSYVNDLAITASAKTVNEVEPSLKHFMPSRPQSQSYTLFFKYILAFTITSKCMVVRHTFQEYCVKNGFSRFF